MDFLKMGVFKRQRCQNDSDFLKSHQYSFIVVNMGGNIIIKDFTGSSGKNQQGRKDGYTSHNFIIISPQSS